MTGMDKKFDLPECSAKATAQDNISGGMLRVSRGKHIKKEAAGNTGTEESVCRFFRLELYSGSGR